MNVFARSHTTNVTQDALQVICGYPLSEPYQLMPRVVLYPLLVIAFWSRTAMMVVILWTSVTAIHVIALAKNHTYAALDLDMIPAYAITLLGAVFGPSYLVYSQGFKKYRIDVFAGCLWLILLWCAMVAYVSTTQFQPQAITALDIHGHNITSWANITQCTFQCFNVTNMHTMRPNQNATLLPVPSAFFEGRGITDHYIIFWTVMMGLFIMLAFWMASKSSFTGYVYDKVRKQKNKKNREETAKLLILAPKVSFWGFIVIVWFLEDAIKHFPPHEHKDTISQWGPLVAFALAVVGFVLRLFLGAEVKDPTNPNRTEFQKKQNAAAMGLTRPHDVEQGNAAASTTPQQPAAAHLPASRPEASGAASAG